MTTIIVNPGRYDPYLCQWLTLEQKQDDDDPCTRATLTVATFNVWQASFFFEQRCQATLALLETLQPDLIALQEVTPRLFNRILATPWVQAGYALSDISGDSVDPYGVLLLSRAPITDWQVLSLPTAMGRSLVTARTVLNGQPLTFASVHLESMSYAAPTRTKQLRHVVSTLAPEPHVLLVGDFNFCATSEENTQLDQSYLDIWPALHPAQVGYTIDTGRNAMCLERTGKPKQVRYDRILLRSQPARWHAETIMLIGTEQIDEPSKVIFPSDHFGLMCQLQWR